MTPADPTTSRHLVLLPAPEAEWADLPAEEHERGQRNHERFHRRLADEGHRVLAGGPLTPSERAVSMRPDGDGGVLLTDGPFAESAEQLVGFYLVETTDREALLAAVAELASGGDHVELRDLAGEGDERAGQPDAGSSR